MSEAEQLRDGALRAQLRREVVPLVGVDGGAHVGVRALSEGQIAQLRVAAELEVRERGLAVLPAALFRALSRRVVAEALFDQAELDEPYPAPFVALDDAKFIDDGALAALFDVYSRHVAELARGGPRVP